jgi:methyltransferase (TIGR00027 family)
MDTMVKNSRNHIINDKEAAVPFTARLIAHYRAQESKRENPLIVDPYAERLVGDLSSYFEKHKRTARQIDYAIVRSYYIENDLLTPWCEKQNESQIVILGAGLDTRAYRFKPLRTGSHTIFEIDFPAIIRYKERILQNEKPLCNLIRISTNLSKREWTTRLKAAGFSTSIPTFWIAEGVVYYLEKDIVTSILRNASEISDDKSEIFVDLCIPIFADLQYGPFTMHFKWGFDKQDVSSYFSANGWSVTCSYADDHDQGRDVGQKGMMFVNGGRDLSNILDLSKDSVSDSVPLKDLKGNELKAFAKDIIMKKLPEIEAIVELYYEDAEDGLKSYLDFIRVIKPTLDQIAKGFRDLLSLGNISPRLLSDPLSISEKAHDMSSEEKEAYVTGYLTATLQLLYCALNGFEGKEFTGTELHVATEKRRADGRIKSLLPLIEIMKHEVDVFKK